jgi:hypothetical protein
MKALLILFTALIFLAGCQKDKEILSGEIKGIVNLYKVDYTQPHDKSGVNVSLYMDSIMKGSTVTDIDGEFHFYDMPYGRYHFYLQKDSCVPASSWVYDVYHVGGASPTITEIPLFTVPAFQLTIDSLVQQKDWFYFDIYWKIDGDTVLPYNYYPVIFFCNNTPEVSKENYIAYGWAYLQGGRNNNVPYGSAYNVSQAFNEMTGTIYMRFYPVALGQDQYIDKDVNPAAIGKPSNVADYLREIQ